MACKTDSPANASRSGAASARAQVREIAEARPQGLVLLVNAQWQGGQAISDFGVGPWRRRTEQFLGSFTEVYSLRQFRIFGDNVRCFPRATCA